MYILESGQWKGSTRYFGYRIEGYLMYLGDIYKVLKRKYKLKDVDIKNAKICKIYSNTTYTS